MVQLTELLSKKSIKQTPSKDSEQRKAPNIIELKFQTVSFQNFKLWHPNHQKERRIKLKAAG